MSFSTVNSCDTEFSRSFAVMRLNAIQLTGGVGPLVQSQVVIVNLSRPIHS